MPSTFSLRTTVMMKWLKCLPIPPRPSLVSTLNGRQTCNTLLEAGWGSFGRCRVAPREFDVLLFASISISVFCFGRHCFVFFFPPSSHHSLYFFPLFSPLFLCTLRANWPRDGDKSSLSGRRPSAQTILLFSPVLASAFASFSSSYSSSYSCFPVSDAVCLIPTKCLPIRSKIPHFSPFLTHLFLIWIYSQVSSFSRCGLFYIVVAFDHHSSSFILY